MTDLPEFIARKLINGSVYGGRGEGGSTPLYLAEAIREIRGLNSVEQDNGRLYRTVYLHRNLRIGRFGSLAVRSEDKKEWRGGRAESIPPFRTCPEISNPFVIPRFNPPGTFAICLLAKIICISLVEFFNLVVARDSLIYDLVITARTVIIIEISIRP